MNVDVKDVNGSDKGQENEAFDNVTVPFPVAPGIVVTFDYEGIAQLCNAQDLVPGLPIRDYEVASA